MTGVVRGVGDRSMTSGKVWPMWWWRKEADQAKADGSERQGVLQVKFAR